MSRRAYAYMSDEQAALSTCANCGERIAKDDCPFQHNHYYHPNLVDVDCSGQWCANGETEAEPQVPR